MLPNPNDLHFFLEIALTLNLSRASERLGVTQPALSQAMKRLEHNFGQQLLLRGKSGVQLTKAGEKLRGSARELLESWESLKAQGQKEENDLKGHYSLGVHSSVALFTLKYFIPDLLTKYHELSLKIIHGLSRNIVEEIISFKIDFGIVVNPVQHPDLIIKELFKDEVCFWRSKKETPCNIIDGPNNVLIAEPSLLQTQTLLAKSKRKTSFSRTMTSNNLEVIKDLVIHGAGIGILPKKVVGIDSKKLEIIESLPIFSDKISLIFRADFQKSLAARKLGKEIQKRLC